MIGFTGAAEHALVERLHVVEVARIDDPEAGMPGLTPPRLFTK